MLLQQGNKNNTRQSTTRQRLNNNSSPIISCAGGGDGCGSNSGLILICPTSRRRSSTSIIFISLFMSIIATTTTTTAAVLAFRPAATRIIRHYGSRRRSSAWLVHHYYFLCNECCPRKNHHLNNNNNNNGVRIFLGSSTSLQPRRSLSLSSSASSSSSSVSSSSSFETASTEPSSLHNDPDLQPQERTLINNNNIGSNILNDRSITETRRNNKTRFRQHVNPLTRQHQQPITLSEMWPRNVFFDRHDTDDMNNNENHAREMNTMNSMINNRQQRPLHLDIGCGKGGFLLQLAAQEISNKNNNDKLNKHEPQQEYNYLGLEIRHSVADFAKERISRRQGLMGRVDFLGCNANVDLDRILHLYHTHYNNHPDHQDRDKDNNINDNNNNHHLLLKRVTIQYPDPHFKTRHAKRRVVTPQLVQVLAKYMKPSSSSSSSLVVSSSSSLINKNENEVDNCNHGIHTNIINIDNHNDEASIVFLQSDIENVLHDMQQVFEDQNSISSSSARYFTKLWNHTSYTADDNPLHVPTEREVSVLKQGLPVYRALFVRNNIPYDDNAK